MAKYRVSKLTIRVPLDDPVYKAAMAQWPGLTVQKVIDIVMREWYVRGRNAPLGPLAATYKEHNVADSEEARLPPRNAIIGGWLEED
jgi:hypothetical protein